ncbi:YihY/virulence factor BrkB family protein [Naasia lichenicola]|uniref:YihY/virulence factor BrkB family protein n=1 Tax=Naasia lichenicola TaxID=2565933 RepID=A0A4S4FPG3_9MICO|nr:YihY/virulence factor BrkB family protein [Naasia lichenicola]
MAYAFRRAGHGFIRTRGLDSAAALTFFSALTLFPASLATLSGLAIIGGNDDSAIDFVLSVVNEVADDSTVETVRGPLDQLTNIPNPWLAFAAGLVVLLWVGSAYATAFGRALNSLYGVQEGRRIWKFRSLMLIVAAGLAIGMGLATLLLLGTPNVADAAAELLGFGEPWVTVWNVVRWPLLVGLASTLIAALYYWTPTVERQSAPYFSYGAVLALIGWTGATTLFWVYVTHVAHYDELYGYLGGALVILLWLYISNLVLIFGAGLDAELVRVRQLRGGIESEVAIRVPMRDTSRNLVIARSLARDEAEGRAIRLEADAEREQRAKHLVAPLEPAPEPALSPSRDAGQDEPSEASARPASASASADAPPSPVTSPLA